MWDCAFCVYLANRAKLIDDEGLPLFFLPRLLGYLMWLFKEILISNLNTAKAIISNNIKPETFTVKASQITDVAKVTYANSITLTPGTITMLVRGDMIHVHVMSQFLEDDLLEGAIERKVAEIFEPEVLKNA